MDWNLLMGPRSRLVHLRVRPTMQLDDKKVKDVLLSSGYLSPEEVTRAEEFAGIHGSSLADALFVLGLSKRDLLGQALAESYNVPYAKVTNDPPSAETVLKIPEEVTRKLHVLCTKVEDARIIIASVDPHNAETTAALQVLFPGKEVAYTFAFPEDIERFFLYYRKPLSTRFAEIVARKEKIAPEITVEIIRDALDYDASDIHFEPQEKEVVIRFRVDSVLYQAGSIPMEYYPNILNRIKVMAHLRVDEHTTSQDGAIRHKAERDIVDIRISIIPTVEGEKVAMRVLSRHVNVYSFGDIGLSMEHQKLLSVASKSPAGMIIVSGPTGSGKTTTLYTIINALNTPEVNITTIEDPVEYKMRGINQIQVNAQTGLTFAKGLRSIVRQDPNIILVGEIRDTETAEISANAALTGHLVLSSFHAIDTPSVITRLLHMDIEPTVLASTLELVITQRLVRKICEVCRVSNPISQKELSAMFPQAPKYFPGETVTLFKGKGCNTCSGFGYTGRIAIFEFMVVTQELRELIIAKPSLVELRRAAYRSGTRPMFEDGIEKVKNGTTTIEELFRVATAPQGWD